ncbi:hypothetical protein [Nostoc sp. T09]|uniref:hypothetical protein n=1 Tax=Nostoc sp. T09 TaxID=1932621 RepID=UPI001180D82E|nr:hypothetical protein [Nostoc sp. T09]
MSTTSPSGDAPSPKGRVALSVGAASRREAMPKALRCANSSCYPSGSALAVQTGEPAQRTADAPTSLPLR